MAENDKINQLRKEIENEEAKIRNCSHIFDEAFYDPTTEKEAYGQRMIGQGSDVWYEPEGYVDVIKPRWTRKCSECGFLQHTNKTKSIIHGKEPNF